MVPPEGAPEPALSLTHAISVPSVRLTKWQAAHTYPYFTGQVHVLALKNEAAGYVGNHRFQYYCPPL